MLSDIISTEHNINKSIEKPTTCLMLTFFRQGNSDIKAYDTKSRQEPLKCGWFITIENFLVETSERK